MNIFDFATKLNAVCGKISDTAREMVSEDVRRTEIEVNADTIRVNVGFGTKLAYYPSYSMVFDLDQFMEGSDFGDNDYPSPVALMRNIGFEKAVLKILREIIA